MIIYLETTLTSIIHKQMLRKIIKYLINEVSKTCLIALFIKHFTLFC